MAETTAELIAEGKDVTTTLTDPERGRLAECESIIKEGLGTFLAVGRALAEIHDNRLYRETHKSFKKYCSDIWGLGKTAAEQKINSYKVVDILEEKMPAIAGTFSNEFQLRPLTRLNKSDDLLKACGLIKERLDQDPKVKLTNALVNKAVKEVRGETAKNQIQKTKKAVDDTSLLSRQFKNQYQVMLDIIVAAKNEGFVSDKRSEVVKHLEALVKIAKSDD